MLKRVPIGFSDYERVQTDNFYVVDKTLMIAEFLTRKSKVTLITRPRRFGKTLNMSMMAEFFDITKDSKEIFKNTKISETEYYHEMNQYPTIFLSFGNCKGDFKSMERRLCETIRHEYGRYYSLFKECESDKPMLVQAKKTYEALCEAEDFVAIDTSIKILSQFLFETYDKRVMIFIDEYDTPFIDAHLNGEYEGIKSDLSALFKSTFKDNESLEYAMLTGIQQVSRKDVFSHLNNMLVCTVKDKEYAQCFGYTNEETEELLEYCGAKLDESVKKMYNSYNMGGIEMYNPWSINNYSSRKELAAYWLDTGGNRMLKEAMKTRDVSFGSDFEKLIQDGYLDVETNLATSFYEVRSNSNLWGMFVNAGYLTIDQVFQLNFVRLRVPNHEVRKEFVYLTAFHLGIQSSALYKMFAALEDKRAEDFLRQYRFTLMDLPSYHDLKGENSYHTEWRSSSVIMLGMCAVLRNDYDILSNREAGSGRCDTVPLRYIVLKAKLKELPSYAIEFKYTKEETDLTQLAMQAIEQIKSRQYDFNLEGEVIYVGLAHHGKEVEMVWNSQQ